MKGYEIEKCFSVSKLIDIKITGNVIPLEWFNHIKRKKGKPHTTAIMLLADIVYWYRPIEKRDEETGKLLDYRKKFAADKLQRSYKAFADLYGYTKNQVREALSHLEKMELVDLEYRHPVINGQKFGNVLYIGLNVDNLLLITYPLSDLNHIGYQEINGEASKEIIGDPPQFKSDTNTETSTEITLIEEILSFWKKHFPNKPQPQSKTKSLQNKIKSRSKDENFGKIWREALKRASESATLQNESWFDLYFFLHNDHNYQKCYDRWMSWKDKEKYNHIRQIEQVPNLTTERLVKLAAQKQS